MKNYYAEINEVVKQYENHKAYKTKDIDWASDKVDWAWKWRKITREQMEDLATRITKIYEEMINNAEQR